MNSSITIKLSEPHHQAAISDLLDGIQSEFSESIYSQNPPVNPLPILLWVALDNEVVIGTVGIAMLANDNAVLKSMFVQQEYRGAATGISSRLIDTALQHAKDNGAKTIYLGTMAQFKAAQQFYRKHDFIQVTTDKLPADFVINPVDSVFFMRQLNNPS